MIDLSDNKLITQSPIGSWNGSAYTDVTGLIAQGRNGGVWNGPGITTSQTDATSGGGYTSLGVALASEVKGIGPSDTDWGGQTVRLRRVGDVPGGDAVRQCRYRRLQQIDFNASIAGFSGWYNGDSITRAVDMMTTGSLIS
jgi:hypothetical protein